MLMLPTALKISLAIELGDRRKQFNLKTAVRR